MGSIAASCLATPVGEGDNSLLCHRYGKNPIDASCYEL